MLKLDGVCAGYSGREILHEISMEIRPGEITVLAGPNGCGKSTLLKALAGLLPKTGGEILLAGKPMKTYDSLGLARQIAYLPQKRNIPDITLLRLVLHGRFPYLKYPRRYRKQDVEMAWEALRWVEMDHLADQNVRNLSGGMQQKGYIAMALAQDTPVILMDEPTSFLDIAYQRKLAELSRRLAGQGKAVVLVLHDLALAFPLADKMVILSEGRIVEYGLPEEIFQSQRLNQVFGVAIKRAATEDGWQYYYC